MKFVSCMGFGGGFDLGAAQAGLEMAGRVDRAGGFGVPNILANRDSLPGDWETQLSYDDHDKWRGEDWDPIAADVVLGNPPCSGFSTLTQTTGFRGDDSPINRCMWALAEYAGRVAPEVVIFESVQQAFRQGINLMRTLRARIEELTGHSYRLYHVLHNNASLGGCANRKRYFFVASRVPFGVERYPLERVATFDDAMTDLEPLGLTFERQPYRTMPTWWSGQMRDGTGAVDGHDVIRSPTLRRAWHLLQSGVEWLPGETVMAPTRRLYDKLGGDLPRQLARGDGLWTDRQIDKLREFDFQPTPNTLVRWRGDEPCKTITGGACHLILHPRQDRTLTHREAARVQGFPDNWRIWPMRDVGMLGPTWGKGIPVHAGEWIAKWARASIEGEPGSYTDDDWPRYMKVPREDDEYVIDVTNDWVPVLARQRAEQERDAA